MPKRPSPAVYPEIPDPEQYDDYRAWLRRCVKIYERACGMGTMRVLGERLGCSPGHLRNIVAGRKTMTPSFRARTVERLGLPERQARVLALLVRASKDNPDMADRANARMALQALRRERVSEAVPAGPAQETPATLLTLEALQAAGALRRPLDVACHLWPAATLSTVREGMGALQRRADPRPRGFRPLAAPGAPEVPTIQDILWRAKEALDRWPLGQSMLRFAVWPVPDGAWDESVATELLAFQQETEAWAAEARAHAPGEEIVVQHVYLQASPLSAILPSSSRILEAGDLRLFSQVHKNEEEGAQPPPMIDRGPPDVLPTTFAFDDCRDFLSVWFERRQALVKDGMPAYTLTRFQRVSGCSRSTLYRLMTGEVVRFSEERMQGFIKALHLDGDQARDFPLLVATTFARDPLTRAKVLRDRLAIPGFLQGRPAQAAVLATFSSLTHLAIFELARHPDFRADAGWITDRLTTGDAKQAGQALSDLTRIGALVPDAAGVPRPAAVSFWLEAEQRSAILYALHLSLLEHTRAMVWRQPERTRWGAASFVLPVSALDEMAERFRAFHTRLINWLQAADVDNNTAPWELRLFTLQLVPGCEPIPYRPAPESS